MKLLVFAYPGEAQSFIKQSSFVYLQNTYKLNLYKNKDHYLLICEEGVIHASANLSLALTMLDKVSEIKNFGICASLNNKLCLNTICDVTNLYLNTQDQNHYPNIQIASMGVGTVKLLTCYETISDQLDINSLNIEADLIDKEAWALAWVCKKMKRSFYSIKIVSDCPAEDPIKMTKTNIDFWSKKLYKHWLANLH